MTLRKLAAAEIEKIVDFAAEARELLPPYALEKDAHILEAMRLIEQVGHSAPFRLVFCGGTCLSKAYGILDRMSEDVDCKLVPTEETMELSNTKRRQALGDSAKDAIAALEAGGFGEGSVERRSRDANSYTRLDVFYESAFSKPASLRGHLLVEFNHSPLRLEPGKLPVCLLLDKLALGAYSNPFEVECIALQEALAEKLVSFPRRLAMLLASHPDPTEALGREADWDRALVRHLYDARRLLQVHPELAEDGAGLGKLLGAAVRQDMADFADQHPEFVANPGIELSAAMKFAKASPELAAQFDAFVRDMSYEPSESKPSYGEVFEAFDAALGRALASAGLSGAKKRAPTPGR